jgi:hypothetical protein
MLCNYSPHIKHYTFTKQNQMADIKPYTINVPEEKLQRLKQKLALTDLLSYEIEDAGWTYGTPLFVLFPSHLLITH